MAATGNGSLRELVQKAASAAKQADGYARLRRELRQLALTLRIRGLLDAVVEKRHKPTPPRGRDRRRRGRGRSRRGWRGGGKSIAGAPHRPSGKERWLRHEINSALERFIQTLRNEDEGRADAEAQGYPLYRSPVPEAARAKLDEELGRPKVLGRDGPATAAAIVGLVEAALDGSGEPGLASASAEVARGVYDPEYEPALTAMTKNLDSGDGREAQELAVLASLARSLASGAYSNSWGIAFRSARVLADAGFDLEGFASPWNSRFARLASGSKPAEAEPGRRHYHSAARDVDSKLPDPFASAGDFFRAYPESYEPKPGNEPEPEAEAEPEPEAEPEAEAEPANPLGVESGRRLVVNPPFVETLLARAAASVAAAAAEAERKNTEFSAVFVGPAWSDSEFWNILAASPHLVEAVDSAKGEYAFEDNEGVEVTRAASRFWLVSTGADPEPLVAAITAAFK